MTMINKLTAVSSLALCLVNTEGFFSPGPLSQQARRISKHGLKDVTYDDLYFAYPVVSSETEKSSNTEKPSISNTKSKMKIKSRKSSSKHQSGIFSPIVLGAKEVLGEKTINKIRADAILMHSDVIKLFVDTSETQTGQDILRILFQAVDRNGDGEIDGNELSMALERLGFTWLKEKQIAGIIKRADSDKNGVLDLNEFTAEAPKTLKKNLVKLAKKNGGEMGFLV